MMLNGWLKNTTDMETNFNFKSQPATSREQSERLLALGLKKETADCYWFYCDIAKEWKCTILSSTQVFKDYPTTVIPAWSLGRLLEVMRMKASSQIIPLDDTFDRLIEGIETRIKEGYFNKEYLV